MTMIRLEPATPQSRVKHSTTETLRSHVEHCLPKYTLQVSSIQRVKWLLGGIFHFSFKFLIEYFVSDLWYLIWVSTVCLCPTKRMLVKSWVLTTSEFLNFCEIGRKTK